MGEWPASARKTLTVRDDRPHGVHREFDTTSHVRDAVRHWMTSKGY